MRRKVLSLILTVALMLPMSVAPAFAVGRVVPVADSAGLTAALLDLQDGDQIVLGAGVFDVGATLLGVEALGLTGWTLPVTANNVVIRGAGAEATVITSSADSIPDEGPSSTFAAVFGDSVAIEDLTLVPKNRVSDVMTVFGSGFTLQRVDILVNDAMGYEWSGRINIVPPMGDAGMTVLQDVFVEAGSVVSGALSAGSVTLERIEVDNRYQMDGTWEYAPPFDFTLAAPDIVTSLGGLTARVSDAPSGLASNVVAKMPDYSLVELSSWGLDAIPADVFTAVSSYADMQLRLTKGEGLSWWAWTFDSADLVSPAVSFAPDLTIRTTTGTDVGDMYAAAFLDSDSDVIEVAQAEEGPLPGPATLEFAVDEVFADREFSVAMYDPDAVTFSPTMQTVSPDETGVVSVQVSSAGVVYLVAEPDDDPVAFAEVAGPDLFGTAAAISRMRFAEGARGVVLATSAHFSDAACGASLAGPVGGPVLYTRPDSIPQTTLDEMDRLDSLPMYSTSQAQVLGDIPTAQQGVDTGALETIYILGGTKAVSPDVEALLGSRYPAAEIIRIGGQDMYETSALIAREVIRLREQFRTPEISAQQVEEFGGPRDFVFATGEHFADATAATSLTAQLGIPLLLVRRDSVPDPIEAFLDDFGLRHAVVMGGELALASGIETALQDRAMGAVERLGGTDFFDTSGLLADFLIDELMFDPSTTVVVTGTSHFDAVAIAGGLAWYGAPFVFVRPAELPEPGRTFLTERYVTGAVFFGGTFAISQPVRDEVISLLRPARPR